MTERIREFSTAHTQSRRNPDELTFPVTDRGPIDGEVVLLLHGFPQTSKCWDQVCEKLNADGFRTITFDQRGYAQTAQPKGRLAYRSSALVGDVTALIDRIGSRVHLVGHDWGAVVAWATAARHPELLKSLTAVSVPHPRAFMRALYSSNQAAKSYYMAVFQIPWLPETMLARYPKVTDRMLGNSGMDEAALRAVREDIIEARALKTAMNWYRAIPFSTPKYMAKVSVPTTYVWSTDDIALGRKGADLCKRYVDAPYHLEVIEGSHWIPEQHPERLAELIADRAKG